MSHRSNSNNGNTNRQNDESEPTPLSRRDYEVFRDSFDSAIEVKNSMPAPPNPNRGEDPKDE
jgi:hypothetical protein